jgi:hypothetical protein
LIAWLAFTFARIWVGEKAGDPEDHMPYWWRNRPGSTVSLEDRIAMLPGAVNTEIPSWAKGPALEPE